MTGSSTVEHLLPVQKLSCSLLDFLGLGLNSRNHSHLRQRYISNTLVCPDQQFSDLF